MKEKNIFPDKFISRHEEELLRSKCINYAKNDKDFLFHFSMIEKSMDVFYHFSHVYINKNHQQLIIQLLGIRLFNESAAAIKIIMSGYYQASVCIQRTLLEMVFLLDYFTTNKNLIDEWYNGDEKSRSGKFSPFMVRQALDIRDGFKEKNRQKKYKMLCELGAHPTPNSFKMLCPSPNGIANFGPFFKATAVKDVIEELVKITIQGSLIFYQFFELRTLADLRITLSLIIHQNEWFLKFYNKKLYDQSAILIFDKILLKIEKNKNPTQIEIEKLISDFDKILLKIEKIKNPTQIEIEIEKLISDFNKISLKIAKK